METDSQYSRTKHCTPVFDLLSPIPDNAIDFQQRDLILVPLSVKPLKYQVAHDAETLRKRLLPLIESLPVQDTPHKKQKVSKGERLVTRINSKWKDIESLLLSSTMTLSQIAKKLKVAYSTVRSASLSLKLSNQIPKYKLARAKTPPQIAELDYTLKDRSYKYLSLRGLKRKVPSFSVAFIKKRLMTLKFKYRQLLKVKQKSKMKPEKPVSEYLTVSSGLTRALEVSPVQLGFVDQWKAVLSQTPKHAWLLDGEHAEIIYNNRPESLTLTLCILCDQTRYRFAQVFLHELNSVDFAYFMVQCLSRLRPADGPVKVLADRASWQKSELLKKIDVDRFMLWNIPGRPQMNMIEGTFSGLRSNFRSREEVESLGDEIRNLLKMLTDQKTVERFPGHRRAWKRQLLQEIREIEELQDLEDRNQEDGEGH